MGEIVQFRGAKCHPDNDETVFLHPVRGDSMEPTARHGDVWIYEAVDRFTGPGVYAITDGPSYPQFRRLQPVPGSGEARVLIVSDNPLYRPQEVALADVDILGRVSGIIARQSVLLH